MTIYIVDIIGSHSGMHFYDRSLRQILLKCYNEVHIVSNYSDPNDSTVRLFKDYYSGNYISKLFKLISSLFKFYKFLFQNRNNCFIFLSYGNTYESFFILPLLLCKVLIIDIHEVDSLITRNRLVRKIHRCYFRKLFRKYIKNVIVHSKRTDLLLNEIGYDRVRLLTPHFSYNLDNPFQLDINASEVTSLLSDSKTNILFFGFMRMSKGIDTLISVAEMLSYSSLNDKINFIIAGNDPDDLVNPILNKYQRSLSLPVSKLLRYIRDDELMFLFTNCDYLFLPYRQISQSGVLEMAFHFRKPVITSPIPYFSEMLSLFPSFGIKSKSEKIEDYMKLFHSLIDNPSINASGFYNESDLKRFTEYKNPDHFLEALEKILNGID